MKKNFVYSRLYIQLLLWFYEPRNMDSRYLNFEADSDRVSEVQRNEMKWNDFDRIGDRDESELHNFGVM